MTSLFIDTSDNQRVIAVLKYNDKEYREVSDTINRKPESILLLIDKVCQQAGIEIESIEDIRVNEGPGSYTGLKVGVSVANALSFALGKKVNDKEVGEIIEPKYE